MEIAENSVAHYLIELTAFILYNQDLRTPLATIMTLVDLSMDHHGSLVEELFSMGVPPWIVRIVASYLTERNLIIRYKERKSQAVNLPGGVRQATLMGIWFSW